MMEYGWIISVVGALIAAAAAIVTALRRRAKKTVPEEPIPGGGGRYTMYIDGMNCEHCKANVEAALNAFPGIRASADLRDGSVTVRYSGYPDLALLDNLRRAVEDAGFTVKEIK